MMIITKAWQCILNNDVHHCRIHYPKKKEFCFENGVLVSFVFSPKQFLADGFEETQIIRKNKQNLEAGFFQYNLHIGFHVN